MKKERKSSRFSDQEDEQGACTSVQSYNGTLPLIVFLLNDAALRGRWRSFEVLARFHFMMSGETAKLESCR